MVHDVPTDVGNIFHFIFCYREFVRALGGVTLSDIKTAAKHILPQFLSPETSQTVIICPPSNLEDVIMDFNKTGIELTKYEQLEQTFLSD